YETTQISWSNPPASAHYLTVEICNRRPRFAGFCLFAAALCIPLRADTVSYTLLGTFDSSAILVPGLMGPNQFFEISFGLPAQPIPSASSPGQYFDAGPAPLTYLVGGVPTALDSSDVDFQNPAAKAGYNLIVSATNGQDTVSLLLQGSALYSGPESGPMLLSAFPLISSGAYAWENHQDSGSLVNPFLLVEDADSPAPEPTTLAVFPFGLSLMAGAWFLRVKGSAHYRGTRCAGGRANVSRRLAANNDTANSSIAAEYGKRRQASREYPS
ncbi:MAG: hypothetical protein ACRD5L_02425, partial [Bryobacteraceae bacterium]